MISDEFIVTATIELRLSETHALRWPSHTVHFTHRCNQPLNCAPCQVAPCRVAIRRQRIALAQWL